VIEPGQTSAHHIHPWEHAVYVLQGKNETQAPMLRVTSKAVVSEAHEGQDVPHSTKLATFQRRS
jgi:hypothetical protein